MKTYLFFFLSFAVLGMTANLEARRLKFAEPVIQKGFEILIGGSSVYLAGEAIENYELSKNENWSLEFMKKEFENLVSFRNAVEKERQNINKDLAVYSVYVKFSSSSTDKWFTGYDVWPFHKPDLFVTLDIEGAGSCIFKKIIEETKNGTVYQETAAFKKGRLNGRLVLNLFDDDSFSNAVWDSILRSKFQVNIGAEYKVEAGLSGLSNFVQSPLHANATGKVGYGAKGEIKLLDQDVVIDGADLIGQCELRVPNDYSEPWKVSGKLLATDGERVGHIEFGCLWSYEMAQQKYSKQVAYLDQQIDVLRAEISIRAEKEAKRRKRIAYGVGGAAFLGLIFIISTLRNKSKEEGKTQQDD